jgi:prevent-host-death family protein
MKTVSEDEAKAELIKMLDASQVENVVITRNGRPHAVLVGLADYDAEDLDLVQSHEFWQMIEERRSGSSLSLAEVKARLEQRESNGPQISRSAQAGQREAPRTGLDGNALCGSCHPP